MMFEQIPKAMIFGACSALILILLHSVSADYCVDNNTLSSNTTINNQTIEWQRTCDSGCSDGSCNPSQFAVFIWIIIIGIVSLVIYILLKKSGAIK